ncbi:AAA family ATPase [Halorubrum sp. CBA1125]|uniref:3'-5' exonuclease n=1 Tax=Halorubrum sp. CBA1125 TaxID=2668072 RepID=UPI0012E95216|nr:3'-5' exonuclease [Halorubrum sp. CBA1125]MUW13485.1 AAA family ATPase [Halorubrum sp. CBA1125]
MVHDAVDTIQQHPELYKDRYEHLLVDEFQDIGKGKLELIQGLTGKNAAQLFAVGDDWQSIYSFQGAVIDYFTDFRTYFGDPVRTELTANFRSPPTPIEAGNDLIENNSNQLDKTVQPTLDRDHTPRVHVLRGYQFYDYVRRVRRYAVNLVSEYIASGADPSDIMVLCRYDDAVPYLSEIKDGLQSQHIPYTGKSDQYRGPNGSNDDGVSVYSLYQAKGREAKHVILVHAAEGPYGFPSDRRERELLAPVKPLEIGGLEEERRAFYVAITRTKHTLGFLTRAEKQSQFLDEIDEYTDTIDAGQVEPLDDVGERMTVIAEVDQLLDPWTKQHQRGILADRYGGSARFVSWSNTDPPTLEADEWYRLTNLKVGEFNDEKELTWTADSTAQQLSTAPSITENSR